MIGAELIVGIVFPSIRGEIWSNKEGMEGVSPQALGFTESGELERREGELLAL